jgi:hypothetical protein
MEIRIEESQEPIRVETADVSISGCYVEMAMTLDVEKALNLVLWLGHKKVSIGGRVVTRHPQFGNGIEFTGALTDFREQLRCFLEGGNAVSVDGQSVPEKGLC